MMGFSVDFLNYTNVHDLIQRLEAQQTTVFGSFFKKRPLIQALGSSQSPKSSTDSIARCLNSTSIVRGLTFEKVETAMTMHLLSYMKMSASLLDSSYHMTWTNGYLFLRVLYQCSCLRSMLSTFSPYSISEIRSGFFVAS